MLGPLIYALGIIAFLSDEPRQQAAATELQDARAAWVQCVQDLRNKNGRPPSSGFFGPRFEVRAAQFVCRTEVNRTRAALESVENAAGRSSVPKTIDRLMSATKLEVAASLKDVALPTPRLDNSRIALNENISVQAAASLPVQKACHGSVSKGLKAYNSGDYAGALCHWLPKAGKGDPAAQNNMGLLFEIGATPETPKSDAMASRWFMFSAQQGFVLGMRNLAQVQARLGYGEAASSWLSLADSTEQQQQLARSQAMQEGMASLGYAFGCALAGGCTPTSAPAAVSPVFVSRNASEPGVPSYTPSAAGLTIIQAPVSSALTSGAAYTLCADGSYVGGSRCTLAPDGSYLGGIPRLTPNGTYVAGSPHLTPVGTYVGGTGAMTLCPDGTYVAGKECRLMPSGKYIGR